jgi:hypothetical protein
MTKLTREQKIEIIARNLCKLVGIEAIDSTDGSANWFMFGNDAEQLVNGLEARGFAILDWIELKDEAKDDA